MAARQTSNRTGQRNIAVSGSSIATVANQRGRTPFANRPSPITPVNAMLYGSLWDSLQGHALEVNYGISQVHQAIGENDGATVIGETRMNGVFMKGLD